MEGKGAILKKIALSSFEDERVAPSAVPPRFTGTLPRRYAHRLGHHPGFAVTGSPVQIYSPRAQISAAITPNDFDQGHFRRVSQPGEPLFCRLTTGLLLLASRYGFVVTIIAKGT